MNKALHFLVYLFVALAAAGLWFELQLNEKRALLTDRNRMQEEFFIKLGKTIEKSDPKKDAVQELKIDTSPVNAEILDNPEQDDLLEDYNAWLEDGSVETYDWDNQPTKDQLRMVYLLDPEGKPMMDGNVPVKTGPGTEFELLNKLFDSANAQRARLNTARDQLKKLREKLEETVGIVNKMKPEYRADKVVIEEQKAKIAKLEEEKSALEDTITKIKAQIDDLNAQIASLNDELSKAKDDIEEQKDELAKKDKLIEQLKKLLQEYINNSQTARPGGGIGTAVATIPAGDKGKLIQCDNDKMFAIVEFTDETMSELRGPNRDRPLPAMELGVKRAGFKGAAGEFVGRIRLRQEVRGKNYVICDILGDWEQDKLQPNDTVFAD